MNDPTNPTNINNPVSSPVPPTQPAAPVPQPHRATSGLGITALVLGICALLISFIPIVNNLSFLVALVGLVLGIIGLVACVRGKKSGKGIAVGGVVLCALSLIVVLATQSMFSAALNGASSKASTNSAEAGANVSAAPAADAKYLVSIDGAVLGTDYQGRSAVVVTYTFTNDSDSDTSFMVATSAKAFQNGVQLDSAIGTDADAASAMKQVKPGGTITLSEGYVLVDESPITVEVSELFSLSDDLLAQETFSLN